MDTSKKETFENILKRNKEENEKLIENMKKTGVFINSKESTGDLSGYDNHPADMASDLFQTEFGMGIRTMFETNIKNADEALERVKEGKYGVCESCSKNIDEERLKVIPETKLCIDCARDEDRIKKEVLKSFKNRPPEEKLVDTPSGQKATGDPLAKRKSMDSLDDVLQYGSAQSPQEEGNYRDFDEYMADKSEQEGIVEEVDKISNEEYWEQL